ncbi:Uncharacterized protein SCF082_LOCUS11307 [Durusdinium trenchii]
MAAFLSVLPKQQQNRTQPTQELDDLAQTHRISKAMPSEQGSDEYTLRVSHRPHFKSTEMPDGGTSQPHDPAAPTHNAQQAQGSLPGMIKTLSESDLLAVLPHVKGSASRGASPSSEKSEEEGPGHQMAIGQAQSSFPFISPPPSPLEGSNPSRPGSSPCAVRTLSESGLVDLMPQIYGMELAKAGLPSLPDPDGPSAIPGFVTLRIDEEKEDEENEENIDAETCQRTGEASLGVTVLKATDLSQAADYRIVLQQVEEEHIVGDEDVQQDYGRLTPIPESKGGSTSIDDPADSKASHIEDSKRSSNGSKRTTSRTSRPSVAASRTAHINSFAISKTLQTQTGLTQFVEAVEPSMQVYLEAHCSNGPSKMDRQVILWKILGSFLFLLPALSFGILLLPLARVEAGFQENWVFNYFAHPFLNYVTARAETEIGILRPLAPADRVRVNWIITCFPLVGCLTCFLVHLIGSIVGIFPIPFVVSTSCLPSMWFAMFTASYFVPKDLMTSSMRGFIWFANIEVVLWGVQFIVLTAWLLIFPSLAVSLQLMSSFAVTGMLSGAGWVVNKIGEHYLGVPKYITDEAKVMILFIAFLFSAALLSSAKNGLVLCVMLILDAGKAVAVAMNMCKQLLTTFEQGDRQQVDLLAFDWKSWFCPCCQHCPHWRALPSLLRERWILAFRVQERLRQILADFRGKTIESLEQAEIVAADARLLNQLARYAKLFALVELCEIMVPLMYMLVIGTLHSDTFGYNRERFFLFDQLGDSYDDAMLSNILSFAIELTVFVAIQITFLRCIGFDLLYFAGVVLEENYSYWVLSLASCCCAWLTVLVKHGGHNLDTIRSWLVS